MAADGTPQDPEQAPLETEAGARGALYALFATAADHPDEVLYDVLADGSLAEQVEALSARTGLDVALPALVTDDDYDTLSARYNDLFVIGYAEYEDRTDGSLSTFEPPVPLHESAYRSDASWTSVNLDLARAYDYYGLAVDESNREHHDHLVLILEFAGYLARREAAVDGEPAAVARLDLLDRHLRILVEGMVRRIEDEPGVEFYGRLVKAVDAFTAADRADLAARTEGVE